MGKSVRVPRIEDGFQGLESNGVWLAFAGREDEGCLGEGRGSGVLRGVSKYPGWG